MSWTYFHTHQYSDPNPQHSFTHLSILASVSLSHPQLRARMSRSIADKRVSKQHVTMMTGSGGGHKNRKALNRHMRAGSLKMKRTRINAQNYTSPHRSGSVSRKSFAVPELCCLTQVRFILGNTARQQKATENCAAVICKHRSVHECSTGITAM